MDIFSIKKIITGSANLKTRNSLAMQINFKQQQLYLPKELNVIYNKISGI